MTKMKKSVSILLSLILVLSMFTIIPIASMNAEAVPGASSFYVVGTFSGWETNEAYLMTKNTAAEIDEYLLTGVVLTTSDELKVVETNGSILSFEPVWYPSGTGNNYGENGEIASDGTYTVYFRPNYDGGEDWYYNCIYVTEEEAVDSTEEPTAAPTEDTTEAPTEEPTAAPTEVTTEAPTDEPGTEPVAGSVKYYLIGSMTGWEVNDNYEMFRNTDSETFEYALRTDITLSDQFKVVAFDGVEKTWFPEGTGNNYGENGEITVSGEYTIYFRPNYDGAEDWFYSCIYAAAPSADATEEPGTEPATEPGTEPGTEAATETLDGASSFYVVGTFSGWETNEAYLMTKNTAADVDEYALTGLVLISGDELKIVETNGSILNFEPVWYPSGTENNYEVAADGTYTIYFRPNYDGGEDWYYNCIYAAAEDEQSGDPDLTDAVVAWVFDAEGKTAGDKLSEYGSKDGYAATIGTGTLTLSVDGANGRALEWSDEEYGETGDQIVPIMAAGSKNPWGASPYIQAAFSAANYKSITFTAYLAGSNKAPAEWQLSYSTDGETFTDIEGASFTLSSEKRKILTAYLDDAQIPEDAEGAETLYLRLTATSTTTVAGGSTVDTPTGGEVALNYVIIRAEETEAEAALLGDADCDGDVTILDATAIQRYLVNLPNTSFSEEAADTDGDTEITILDATYIQRWLASLPVDFAIGEPINR